MVVLALTLTVLDRWLVEHASELTTIELVDHQGRVVASNQWHQNVTALSEGRLAALRAGHSFATSGSEQVALAKVPGKLGLTAVASIPLEVARAPVRALRRSVLAGMGGTVLLLVVVSSFFTRWLATRLEKVSVVADAYARGELSRRVELEGGDELAALAKTFNAMGGELEAARAKLMRWNDELKQKVEEALSELRAAQAQLLETQKLAAIGQLGAGVAHEINNPLVGILGNAQLLLMDHAETDDDFALLKQIEESAKRCREITSQLLRFSQKRGEVTLVPIDLRAVVTRTMALEKERAQGVTIDVVLPDAPVRVDGDAEQLEQVLTQLCANARTAMATSGEKKLSVIVEATVTGATLTVRDTGKGIAAEHLGRIFEPFFTTKEQQGGTGLGLATVYGIVQQSQGTISVESAPGRGSTFRIELPAAAEDSLPIAAPRRVDRPKVGTERVLLVENEEPVRKLTTRILRSAGYDVLVAANAGEALLYAEATKRPIRVLVTDVHMPLCDGPRLVARLRAGGIAPPKVLFFSGHPSSDATAVELGSRFLQKPFRADDLLVALRDLLDEP